MRRILSCLDPGLVISGCRTGLLVVLEMEYSGKWPNKITAINDIKTALYVNMARNLRQQYGLVAAPTTDHLDVLKVCVCVVGVTLCGSQVTQKQVCSSCDPLFLGRVRVSDENPAPSTACSDAGVKR